VGLLVANIEQNTHEMDKILLTTDFNERAMTINSYAIDLFGTKVNYILLTGFICDYAQAAKTEGQTFASSEEYRQYRHDRAMTKLNEEKEKLTLAFPGIEIKCKAIEGVAIRAIESATRLYAPDLVVVGTSRLAHAPTRNHASVATRLIGTLPANLLIVPYKHDSPNVKKMVYAFSKLEMNNEILKPFQFLIKKGKREVTMYHVIETEKDVFSNDTVEDFADFMEIKNVKIENVKSRNIVDNVLNYCENNKPDLLVVISREKTYMQDFWIGSKVDELSCQLRQPMLALYDIP
jgi:nucleotide-binding universal stress UspA family protein